MPPLVALHPTNGNLLFEFSNSYSFVNSSGIGRLGIILGFGFS